jgi:hypothetical protein
MHKLVTYHFMKYASCIYDMLQMLRCDDIVRCTVISLITVSPVLQSLITS